ADLDLTRLQPQPAAIAGRAQRISAIAAQENADVKLVFLALQVVEKSAHTQKAAFTIQHPLLLLRLKFRPGQVKRDVRLLGIALQVGEERTILGLGPGLNRAFGQSLALVRDHQIEIEIDGVAESLASRAGAVRIVEGEKPRLR